MELHEITMLTSLINNYVHYKEFTTILKESLRRLDIDSVRIVIIIMFIFPNKKYMILKMFYYIIHLPIRKKEYVEDKWYECIPLYIG